MGINSLKIYEPDMKNKVDVSILTPMIAIINIVIVILLIISPG